MVGVKYPGELSQADPIQPPAPHMLSLGRWSGSPHCTDGCPQGSGLEVFSLPKDHLASCGPPNTVVRARQTVHHHGVMMEKPNQETVRVYSQKVLFELKIKLEIDSRSWEMCATLKENLSSATSDHLGHCRNKRGAIFLQKLENLALSSD